MAFDRGDLLFSEDVSNKQTDTALFFCFYSADDCLLNSGHFLRFVYG